MKNNSRCCLEFSELDFFKRSRRTRSLLTTIASQHCVCFRSLNLAPCISSFREVTRVLVTVPQARRLLVDGILPRLLSAGLSLIQWKGGSVGEGKEQ